MNRTYEDMSKEELITLVTRLTKQHDEWSAEATQLREGIRSILSDYDITELIRDIPEDEWNFEQQALIRMKGMIE